MLSRIACQFFLVILATSLLACSKNSRPAVLSLQFAQKNQGLNIDSPIRHLIVNVSAPDMALVSREFDCRIQDCLNINVEVSAGSSRLLQILMVYDSETASQILYGDVSQNLVGGNNSIRITLAEIGNFVKEGEIMGRYIPTANHPLAGKFLTGDVNVWAPVGAVSPNMRITRSEIFGGWTKIFALDNLGFRFTFSGFDRQGNTYKDVPIFNDLHDSNGLTLSSTGIQGTQRKIASYSSALPTYDIRPDGVEQRPFETQIVGFFGANPDNSILCSETISPSFPFSGGADRSRPCRDSSCNTYFTWADINTAGCQPA